MGDGGGPDIREVTTRAAWVAGLLALAVIGAVGVLLARTASSEQGGAGATPRPTATAVPTPTRPVDPNDAWFVAAQSGAPMKANEVIDDPDLFPLYFDDAEARVYRRHGVPLVRMRSFYRGSEGGAVLKLVTTRRPEPVLRALGRLEPGLGRPYPALPHGRLRRNVTQMESTRAHDVFAYFYTITFAEGPYIVTVEAYSVSDPVGRRRAVTYAEREHDLLRRRVRASEQA